MAIALEGRLQPLEIDALSQRFRGSQPFPFVQIDGFLCPDFAREVARTFPDMEAARAVGRSFRAVNEWGKTQVTDASAFPPPIRALQEALADPHWLATLSRITGIPDLLADEELVGGGMHLMRSGALLDVHVDFNLIEDRRLFRRLNILVFLNEGWRPEWGGGLELWDAGVKTRHHCVLPELNRCVIFETSEKSFHGVQKLSCPPGVIRRSFAAYYYTREAPPGWSGRRHTTIFRARPEERFKANVLMPASRLRRALLRPVRRVARLFARAETGSRPR